MPTKKISPEEKEKQFQQWKETDEFQQLQKFIAVRGKDEIVN